MATVDNAAIVNNAYKTLFGREPDAEGAAYWTSLLNSGTLSGQEFIGAFLGGADNTDLASYQQLQETSKIVQATYNNVLDKQADPEGVAYWSQELRGADPETIVNTIAYNAAPQDQEKASLYLRAQEALQSPKLTQQQYNDLAAYFGNEVLPRDQNQIKDFVGNKSGFEFANYLATRDTSLGGSGDKQAQVNNLQKLILPLTGEDIQVKTTTVSGGGDSPDVTQYTAINPLSGKEEALVDLGNGMFGFQYNQLGRANDDPGKTGYYPQLMLAVDPTTGSGTVIGANPNMGSAGGGSSLLDFAKVAAPFVLNAAFPGLGSTVGTAMGLTGAAATAVGNAIVGGLTTGVITGDADKALIAGLLAGTGTYAMETGMMGDAFDYLGLGDYKDTFNIKNSTQLANMGDVEAQAGGFFGNTPTANYDQATGITSLYNPDGSLRGYTVDPTNNPFNLQPGSYTPTEFQGMLNTTPTGNLPTTTTTGTSGTTPTTQAPTDLGGGLKLPAGAGDMLGVGTAGGGLAGGVAGGTGITPGAAGVTGIGAGAVGAGTGLLSGVGTGSQVADAISNLLGNQSIQGLIGAGIDYARLNELQNLANQQAQAARQEATAAGQLANIPFTPYTVTSGAGTTAFGTNAAGQPTATVSASPEYEALRQQALQASGQALGSIAPGSYAQSLYERARSLAAPTEQRQQEQLLSTLGARGLLGISRNLPTTGGTTAGVNPYLESLLSSQRTADVNLALQAQQAGTQEAQRQAALAQALQSQAQGIDTQALQTLSQGAGLGATATQLNQAGAARQLGATLAGQDIGSRYDIAALNAQAQALGGAGAALKGLFGLPTTAGNTPSNNLVQQGINYLGGIFS